MSTLCPVTNRNVLALYVNGWDGHCVNRQGLMVADCIDGKIYIGWSSISGSDVFNRLRAHNVCRDRINMLVNNSPKAHNITIPYKFSGELVKYADGYTTCYREDDDILTNDSYDSSDTVFPLNKIIEMAMKHYRTNIVTVFGRRRTNVEVKENKFVPEYSIISPE